MIRGRRDRNRIINRAETIYTSVIEELLIFKDSITDYHEVAKKALDASIAFDTEITRQLGPDDEATNQYDADTTDY